MYESYLEHVKSHKESNTSIERIQNTKGYNKTNCRWATMREQASNRRNTLYFLLNKTKYTIRELSDLTGISYKNLFNRLVILKWSITKTINKLS